MGAGGIAPAPSRRKAAAAPESQRGWSSTRVKSSGTRQRCTSWVGWGMPIFASENRRVISAQSRCFTLPIQVGSGT